MRLKEDEMAGFSKIYCIGGTGGFEGADGINPIDIQIWMGDGDRRWFEVHYFKEGIQPIGNIKKLVPESADDPDALLDACLAFFPDYFKYCPALSIVKKKLQKKDWLDFDREKKSVPVEWADLRMQARPLFEDLTILEADLVPMRRSRAKRPDNQVSPQMERR